MVKKNKMAVLKRKLFMILVEDSKAQFIKGKPWGRCRDHCNEVLQQDREVELTSEYRMGKWEFTIKEQCGVQWLENYYEEISRVRGNSNQIGQTGLLLTTGQGDQPSPGEVEEEHNQIWKVELGVTYSNDLSGFFLKLDFTRKCTGEDSGAKAWSCKESLSKFLFCKIVKLYGLFDVKKLIPIYKQLSKSR